MPALTPKHVAELEAELFKNLWSPLRTVFVLASERGEIRASAPDTWVGAFLSLMDGLTYFGTSNPQTQIMEEAADELITMMVKGLAP